MSTDRKLHCLISNKDHVTNERSIVFPLVNLKIARIRKWQIACNIYHQLKRNNSHPPAIYNEYIGKCLSTWLLWYILVNGTIYYTAMLLSTINIQFLIHWSNKSILFDFIVKHRFREITNPIHKFRILFWHRIRHSSSSYFLIETLKKHRDCKLKHRTNILVRLKHHKILWAICLN